VGRPRLDRRAGRTTGVRFTLGAFTRGDPAAGAGSRIVPVERLELTLVKSAGGAVARTLTPPGGELGLLPGEYAYRLPQSALRDLAGGAYRFRVRAWSPRSARPAEQVSEAFEVA
jgi:hypothetical protein